MAIATTQPLVEVRVYRKIKEFERDAQKRIAAGWTLQGQSADSGHVGLGGAVVSGVTFGLPGMVGLQGMRKGKTVVTWIHHNPSPQQIKAANAQKHSKRDAFCWSVVALVTLFLGAAFPPLFIVTLVAFVLMIKAMLAG